MEGRVVLRSFPTKSMREAADVEKDHILPWNRNFGKLVVAVKLSLNKSLIRLTNIAVRDPAVKSFRLHVREEGFYSL